MGNPRPVAPFLLLEPSDSAYAGRIESAAIEAGLSVQYLDSIEAAPADAPLIGVGPTVRDPLHVARHRRAVGPQAMLVFFTASTSARAALQAELVRDPFLYPRFELVELPDNARQLAFRMGRVASHAKRQLHARRNRGRRNRPRSGPGRLQMVVAPEQFLAHVLARSHDAILSTDEHGRIHTWNEACEAMFGIRAESALGRRVALLDGTAEPQLSHLINVSEDVVTRVPADEQKLAQVLRAYIGNALKFTPAGGRITIHVGPDAEVEDGVRISVTDSGVGMREEQIALIWERFYQGDASLTRAYGGMGLGLSIARHLVTLHGGSVGAESRGPGLGSTFWVTLPRS